MHREGSHSLSKSIKRELKAVGRAPNNMENTRSNGSPLKNMGTVCSSTAHKLRMLTTFVNGYNN